MVVLRALSSSPKKHKILDPAAVCCAHHRSSGSRTTIVLSIMAWDGNYGSSGWSESYAGQYNPNSRSTSSGSNMQPHYASAYYAQGYYAQPSVPQPMQITVPSPGFARNQPMASLVPIHMRNRVGPVRCGHEGCMFAGSHKEVEVHKMDRHLIFPPGWQENQARGKRKRGKDKEEGEGDVYIDEEAQFLANG